MSSEAFSTVVVARHAMATRFEIALSGGDAARLRAAGEEALDEIERLHTLLNPYGPTSGIYQINQQAAERPVRVDVTLFRLLQHAQTLSAETDGAFDLTIGPLMRCWGFVGESGRLPTSEEIAEARSKVGMHLVELNGKDFTVRFTRPGMRLDVGAIGKGFALERAAEILREAGVTSALLHGGTSTVHALGRQPDGEPWKVALEEPPLESPQPAESRTKIMATVALENEAMSVSAVWGKSFQAGGKTYGHVIDPRTGWPAQGAAMTVVVLPSATETDALSTALLAAGRIGHQRIASLRAEMRSLVLTRNEAGGFHCDANGIEVKA